MMPLSSGPGTIGGEPAASTDRPLQPRTNQVDLIAQTGDFEGCEWNVVKDEIRILLEESLQRYVDRHGVFESTGFDDSFSTLYDQIFTTLAKFDAPPFTIQRLCELTLQPEKFYFNTRKFMNAVLKLVNVSSSLFEYANTSMRSRTSSSTSLSTMESTDALNGIDDMHIRSHDNSPTSSADSLDTSA